MPQRLLALLVALASVPLSVFGATPASAEEIVPRVCSTIEGEVELTSPDEEGRVGWTLSAEYTCGIPGTVRGSGSSEATSTCLDPIVEGFGMQVWDPGDFEPQMWFGILPEAPYPHELFSPDDDYPVVIPFWWSYAVLHPGPLGLVPQRGVLLMREAPRCSSGPQHVRVVRLPPRTYTPPPE